MDQNNKEPQKQLQIELKEEIAQGVYANLAMITTQTYFLRTI